MWGGTPVTEGGVLPDTNSFPSFAISGLLFDRRSPTCPSIGHRFFCSGALHLLQAAVVAIPSSSLPQPRAERDVQLQSGQAVWMEPGWTGRYRVAAGGQRWWGWHMTWQADQGEGVPVRKEWGGELPGGGKNQRMVRTHFTGAPVQPGEGALKCGTAPNPCSGGREVWGGVGGWRAAEVGVREEGRGNCSKRTTVCCCSVQLEFCATWRPRRKPGPLHARTRGDRHKHAGGRWAGQWPQRPSVPVRHKRVRREDDLWEGRQQKEAAVRQR